jgi:hypothetical protein
MQHSVLEVIRQIPGSWRLSIKTDESITITFFPNGHFFWTISAYSATKKAIQIATGPEWAGNWHVRSERGPHSSLSGSSSSSFSSFSLFDRNPRQPVDTGAQGPYLILNFTELSKSILNFQLFGFRIDLANWVNNFAELIRDGNYRIVEFNKDKMRLENPEGIEIWHNVSTKFA